MNYTSRQICVKRVNQHYTGSNTFDNYDTSQQHVPGQRRDYSVVTRTEHSLTHDRRLQAAAIYPGKPSSHRSQLAGLPLFRLQTWQAG
jgi:hypothetical protein